MSNEFKDWIGDFTDEQKKNYELCMKYPILIPHNDDDFMYEYCKLDFFPHGWKIAFGEQWAEEVQEVINKMPISARKEACILDIKEKYGQLCVFLSVHSDELAEVLKRYERLSEDICPKCGKTKHKNFSGWINLLCDDCMKALEESRKELRNANSCH
jgi:hypothetical protein